MTPKNGLLNLFIILALVVLPACQPASQPPEYESIPGVYLGTFHGTKASSVDLFEKLGKGIAISGVYLNWNKGFNNGLLAANSYAGRTTLITWEFMPGSTGAVSGYEGRVLEAIMNGDYDKYIDGWAASMRTFGKPVLLRFGHEMNGDWYPWSGVLNGGATRDEYGDIGEFASTEEGGDKAAWISDTFQKIRTNYPQIRAIIWFHIAKETDWRINSSDAARDAYRNAISDDYWLSEWPGMKE